MYLELRLVDLVGMEEFVKKVLSYICKTLLN
jgi:hypothetical protein